MSSRIDARQVPPAGPAMLLLLCGLCSLFACSWTHYVLIENATPQDLSITYELSLPGSRCFFPDSAVVKPPGNVAPDRWSVYRKDLSDSTISFRLPPGHIAEIATGWNTTYTHIHGTEGASSPADDLVWVRISGEGVTRQYSSAEFLQASDTKRSGQTLLRITQH